MPSINDIELPFVTLSNHDPEQVAHILENMKMPLEAMIEVAIYIKRQREKANALEVIEKTMRDRINEVYETMPPENRETRRTEVGMVTYTAPGTVVKLIDRDKSVEMMTDEQLRITYKPDLKAMETIMKADEFNRHVTRVPTPARTTLRDIPASEAFHELDF